MTGLDQFRAGQSTEAPRGYVEDGFALVPGLFDPGEIVEVAGVVDGLFDDYAHLPAGHTYDLDRRPADRSAGKIPAIRNVLMLRPELRSTRGVTRALALAERLLGGGVEVLWDSAIYKPAGSSSPTPMHQDEAIYALAKIRRPRSMVYFWVALEEVGEASGCMQFIPGSHRGPILPHAWRNGDSKSSLELSIPYDEAAVVSLPLGAGDATVHHHRTLHGSGPNTSGSCRKGWVLGIGQPATPRWLRRLKHGVLGLRARLRGA